MRYLLTVTPLLIWLIGLAADPLNQAAFPKHSILGGIISLVYTIFYFPAGSTLLGRDWEAKIIFFCYSVIFSYGLWWLLIRRPKMKIHSQNKPPRTIPWLVAAILFTSLTVAPVAFIHSLWQNINSFTVISTIIPAALTFILGSAALILWVVWILQLIRSRKIREHMETIRQITLDAESQHAKSRAEEMQKKPE